MAQCPDCYSIKTFPGINEGDGKCAECYGEGHGHTIDQAISSLVGERSKCLLCKGSGRCQTCFGTGVVKIAERERDDSENYRGSSSPSDSSSQSDDWIYKLVFGLAAIIFVIWIVIMALALAVILSPIWLGAVCIGAISAFFLAKKTYSRLNPHSLQNLPLREETGKKKSRLKLADSFFKSSIRFIPDVVLICGATILYGIALAAWPFAYADDLTRILLAVGIVAGAVLGTIVGRRVLCWQLENLVFNLQTEGKEHSNLAAPRVALGFAIPGSMLLLSIWFVGLYQSTGQLNIGKTMGLSSGNQQTRVTHTSPPMSLPFLPTDAIPSKLEGFTIPNSTLSPDGRFGVIAPDFAHYIENSGPQNQLIDVNSKRVLATINADTWVEDSDRTRNHMSLDPHWSRDGSVLGWALGGKWFPSAFVLMKVADAKVVWQLDVLKSVQKEILARTKTAVPGNYQAAKDQNKGNGRAYPDGFTVDVETPKESFSLPLECRVTLTSNPKEISEWPPEANVKASMDAVVERDGSMTFSNFTVDVGRQVNASKAVESSTESPESVKAFATSFQIAESKDDPGVNLAKYADTVNYFDNGKVDHAFIEKDKQDYVEHWPSRKDSLTGPIRITKLENGWSITYPTHFRVENAKGEWAEGDAETSMQVIWDGNSYKITFQDVNVKNRTKGTGLALSTAEALPTQKMRGEQFPETRTRVLRIDEIRNWNDDKFRYAINEMYARHGADFGDKNIKRIFSRFDWYRPVLGKTYDQAEGEFSSVEAENVKLLGETRAAQKSRQMLNINSSKNSTKRVPNNKQQDGDSLRAKTKNLDDL